VCDRGIIQEGQHKAADLNQIVAAQQIKLVRPQPLVVERCASAAGPIDDEVLFTLTNDLGVFSTDGVFAEHDLAATIVPADHHGRGIDRQFFPDLTSTEQLELWHEATT
jgi:hypothetical protein